MNCFSYKDSLQNLTCHARDVNLSNLEPYIEKKGQGLTSVLNRHVLVSAKFLEMSTKSKTENAGFA